MVNFDLNKFEEAKQNVNEAEYEKVRSDVKTVRSIIEKMLTLALENSANLTRTNYAGLEMF
jgi:hypothetical protein